jgi:hypothetical protein
MARQVKKVLQDLRVQQDLKDKKALQVLKDL